MATTVKWVVMKHHKKADGTYNPKIQITHNRTTAYIATQIITNLVKFRKNDKQGRVTDPEVEDRLNELVKGYRDRINRMGETLERMNTAKDVKEYLQTPAVKASSIDFIKFCNDTIDTIGIESTRNLKRVALNSFIHYLATIQEGAAISPDRITSRTLQGFVDWMRRERTVDGKVAAPMGMASVNRYLSCIRWLFNKCLKRYNDYDHGHLVITNDPFRLLERVEPEETKKRALSPDLIRRIYHYSTRRRTSSLARDLMMLSFCLAGMNLVDMYNCPVFTDRVEYVRTKTARRKRNAPFMSISIHPFIAKLVDRYRGEEYGFRLRDLFGSMQTLSHSVQKGIWAMRDEIDIPDLTFYAMRHSFATIARNDCGFSMDDVGACLTHVSLHSITDTYVKRDYSRVDNVVNKVIEFVFADELTSIP